MSSIERLQALLPEYDPRLVERALDLLRQGIPPGEVRFCLGLGPEYALMAREIVRVSWFLVSNRFVAPVPAPLTIEPDGAGFKIAAGGSQVQLSATDALNLLSELYARRHELMTDSDVMR